jgi:hypothetical protein
MASLDCRVAALIAMTSDLTLRLGAFAVQNPSIVMPRLDPGIHGMPPHESPTIALVEMRGCPGQARA